MKNILYLFSILFFIFSCSSLNDAKKVLKNEKIRTTDEFLVKKRDPLILPPDFKEIPKPGTLSKKKKNESEKIKEILKATDVDSVNSKSSTIEDSILRKIKK